MALINWGLFWALCIASIYNIILVHDEVPRVINDKELCHLDFWTSAFHEEADAKILSILALTFRGKQKQGCLFWISQNNAESEAFGDDIYCPLHCVISRVDNAVISLHLFNMLNQDMHGISKPNLGTFHGYPESRQICKGICPNNCFPRNSYQGLYLSFRSQHTNLACQKNDKWLLRTNRIAPIRFLCTYIKELFPKLILQEEDFRQWIRTHYY